MVYVGNLEFPFRRMLMSHMATDGDIEELHLMADKIGVSRRWFQNIPKHPHYDICKSKKQLAIKFGAMEISDREIITRCYPELVKLQNKIREKIKLNAQAEKEAGI